MRSHVRDQRDNQILVGCSEFVHGRDNSLQIRWRKGGMYRQGQHFECSLFGLGQAVVVPQVFDVKTLLVDGDRIIHFGTNAVFIEIGAQRIPFAARHADGVLVKHMRQAIGKVRDRDTFEVFAEEFCIGLALGVELVQFLELRQTNGGMQVGHAEVIAEFIVIVALTHSVLADDAALFVDDRVVGGDHAAFTRGDVFGRIEREGAGAKGTGFARLVPRAMTLAGVLDDGEPMFFSEAEDRIHVAGQTVEVNRHDGFGAGCDGSFDQVWV